jgi:glycosyltransferase involved in cell wall biosynthesis
MKHAIGLVIQNRWKLTKKTLRSLKASPQRKYDLYLVDNGSDPENAEKLKTFVTNLGLPVKHLFLLDEVPMSIAFNLTLYMSRGYKFRVKMDNDVMVEHPRKNFLDVMAKTMRSKPRRKQREIGLVSVLPIAPNWTNNKTLIKRFREEAAAMREFGKPYMFGACLMISKACFDAVGYFDERLWRRIDIDYCHRVCSAGFGLAYAQDYWVIHTGAGTSTEGKEKVKERYREAKRFARRGKRVRGTVWEGLVVPDQQIIDWRGFSIEEISAMSH